MMDIDERKQAEEALQEADRHKDKFLATLAHELRNPLAPIRNAAQILRMKEIDDPEARAARDMMDRQVRQMARLIEDLLDIGRIRQDKLRIRKEPVELAQVVEAAVEASRPWIQEAGHTLTIDLPPGPIHLHADPARLAQVLSNLLENAAKYTSKGGHIRLAAEPPGSEAVVSVRDNGIGIPAEYLPRVFEMFSQVGSPPEGSEGGLGIGLSLVRRLVELHGGRIEAHSEGAGRGSEFIVRLPAVGAPAIEKRLPAKEHRPAAQVSNCRVLVVDDNKDAAESLAAMLRIMGNQVRVAHDGYQALEAAAVFQPEAILLDIGLPGLNGYEAARGLRELPGGTDTLLIAVTGWGQAEDAERSRAAGFDQHLVKPVDPDVVVELLATFQRSGRLHRDDGWLARAAQ
jgi:CheY-like chemotaxis protein